jgi:hypothetical protein
MPFEFKLPLAKLFAECEDKGLGTWWPSFRANPGMENAAADYIGARAAFVAENEFGSDGEPT